jgi:hypothetical protein
VLAVLESVMGYYGWNYDDEDYKAAQSAIAKAKGN